MKDIIHERRVELAGENERHQDLLRWDKAGVIDIVHFYSQDRGPLKPAGISTTQTLLFPHPTKGDRPQQWGSNTEWKLLVFLKIGLLGRA